MVLMLPRPERLQAMALEDPVSVAVKVVAAVPAATVSVCGLTVRFIAGTLIVMVALAVRVPAVAVRMAVVDAARLAGGV